EAVQGGSDAKIASALLSHREQRFRLFYPLGTWQIDQPDQEDEFSFEDEEPEIDHIEESETVSRSEVERNKARLVGFVDRLKVLARTAGEKVSESVGPLEGIDDPE